VAKFLAESEIKYSIGSNWHMGIFMSGVAHILAFTTLFSTFLLLAVWVEFDILAAALYFLH